MPGPSQRPERPLLGIVIPCHDEEAVLDPLFEALTRFAERVDADVRFLLVDDGSRDGTFATIEAYCERDERFACISLSRNFGHQVALSAGLSMVPGDVVAVMDADLQDPPEVLLEMLERWREGFDVVYGIRRNRKESVLLRAAYAAYYRLLKRISNIDIPLDAGDFCLMSRRVVDALNAMPEHNRFLRGLRGWIGHRQIGVPYDRATRHAGRSSYSVRRLWTLALDGITAFSSLPLRLAAWLGAAASLLGFVLLVWAVGSALFLEKTPPGWASLAVLVLFFGGIQLIVLGIMGEYVGRILDEVKARPQFLVARHAGWLEPPVRSSA